MACKWVGEQIWGHDDGKRAMCTTLMPTPPCKHLESFYFRGVACVREYVCVCVCAGGFGLGGGVLFSSVAVLLPQ